MLTRILQDKIAGKVILAKDRNFAQARDGLVWNGRKPTSEAGIIVQAAHAADVQEAVRFAAQLGMKVSPRGGGHQFTGIAAKGQVIIDLGAMSDVSIDSRRGTARVEPGVTNLQMARILADNGVGFPLGHCGSVTMSGYLLGGGIGWNGGEWGTACFSVEAVEVVLPDGQLVTANDHAHADILWAARGAGPRFFGVVTAYHLRLKAAPRAIMTTVRVYPTTAAVEVAHWAERAMAKAPANIDFSVKVSAPPPDAPIGGKVITALTTVFAANEDEGRKLLAAFGNDAPEALQVMEALPTPLEVLYGLIAQTMPDGARYGADAIWSNQSFAEVLVPLVKAVCAAPSAQSQAIAALQPRANLAKDAAFSKIGRIFGAVYGIWDRPDQDDENLAWVRGTIDGLLPKAVGSYIGYSDLGRPGQQHRTHSVPVLARLDDMSQKYDPDGLFRGRVPAAAIA